MLTQLVPLEHTSLQYSHDGKEEPTRKGHQSYPSKRVTRPVTLPCFQKRHLEVAIFLAERLKDFRATEPPKVLPLSPNTAITRTLRHGGSQDREVL